MRVALPDPHQYFLYICPWWEITGQVTVSPHGEPTCCCTQRYDGETISTIIPRDKWERREKVSNKRQPIPHGVESEEK